MSNRTMSQFCKVDKCDRWFFILTYQFFLYIIMSIFFAYEYFKFRNSPIPDESVFASSNLFFLILTFFYAGYILLHQCGYKKCLKFISTLSSKYKDRSTGKIIIIKDETGKEKKPFGGIGWVIGRTFVCGLVNFFIVLFFGALKVITYAISTTELYLFAVFGGMAEELFYRAFLQQGIYDVIHDVILKRKNKLVPGFISFTIAGVAFGLSHVQRYGTDPLMLTSVTLAGISYGVFYFLSEGNIIETMLVHALNNYIAMDTQIKATMQLIVDPYAFITYSLVLVSVIISTKLIRNLNDVISRKKAILLMVSLLIASVIYPFGIVYNSEWFYMLSILLVSLNAIYYIVLKRKNISTVEKITVFSILAILLVVLMYLYSISGFGIYWPVYP